MSREREARDLKRAMGQRGRGRPVPKEVRGAALAYAQHRRSEGASQERIALELGVSQHTVSSWLRKEEARATSALVPVHVVDGPPVVARAVIITTPLGLRIEGLTIEDVCTVISRVG
jgi:hypothetical protein